MTRALTIRSQPPLMQSNTQNTTVSPVALSRRHEAENPKIGRIVALALFVVVMTLVCVVIVHGMMVHFEKGRPPQELSHGIDEWLVAPNPSPLERFPPPHLQVSQRDNLAALRAREEIELSTYGWVDRTAGVVRIPIDRAMALVLERGLPTRASNAPPRTGKSSEQLIQERALQR